MVAERKPLFSNGYGDFESSNKTRVQFWLAGTDRFDRAACLRVADAPLLIEKAEICESPTSTPISPWDRMGYSAARAFAAKAANSSRPNAVPNMPQPPSAASLRITQVRCAWLGSPEIRATISVASFTICF